MPTDAHGGIKKVGLTFWRDNGISHNPKELLTLESYEDGMELTVPVLSEAVGIDLEPAAV